MQIVLAYLDTGVEVDGAWQADLGYRPKLKEVRIAKALMWVNNGTEEDLAKAQQYAAKEGLTVLCYTGEKDPLGKAKADIAKGR